MDSSPTTLRKFDRVSHGDRKCSPQRKTAMKQESPSA